MERQPFFGDFRGINATEDPGYFVNYLETASKSDFAQDYKRRTFELMEIQQGHSVLDVGCGLGDDTRTIARMVGGYGKIFGIDHSAAMIAEAKKRSASSELPVEFRQSDAHKLEFEDNLFDSCRCDRTLQHVESPPKVLDELTRVTHPGGRIVACDPDWDTFIIDSPYRGITRKLVSAYCDDHVRNGRMGRQTTALFQSAGLTNISTTAIGWVFTDLTLADQILNVRFLAQMGREQNLVSPDEASKWLEHLEEADRAGLFFSSLSIFIVRGQKP